MVNADESEPGTCKDRLLMEYDPHQMIEGILIAGLAVDAQQGYIYIRGEYRYLIDIMDRAIAEAYARGYLGKNILGHGFQFRSLHALRRGRLRVRRGIGAARIARRQARRFRACGLRFRRSRARTQSPTVLNNVETFCAVPAIILHGGASFAALGTPKNGGTRLFCLSGHVNKPGVYELPLGFHLMRMINEVGGGMRNGKKLKAVIPGGSSCPLLKADECDLAMDYDTLAAAKSMLGSGGMVVMDEDTYMVKAALRIMRFYAHESCGWCIPCREGTTWLRKMLHALPRRHGTAQRHRADRRSFEKHAGPHVLPAGRCGGDADDFDRREVPRRIRSASRRQAAARTSRTLARLVARIEING